ncbi:chemotaxis protein CheD [Methanoplanus sp. FWC-SCC4]|uniref:Probable chemoreceptor glutamine deamidase CheD n=1 Tax=Methanochimaera problematica TaxID=2609417 RepID=A0AA97I381_9EURY|nr:chemotaxis protein CheD [Methanoplanus sp. FWC-SCC4]WOF15611.1 chemotaxis protein CheD [Methanoplanus sp. FWC-SCC4]
MTDKPPATKGVNVGIGEYHIGQSLMTSIGLGSCVALILHDNKHSMGAVAHIMLPESNGKKERPGKFADTAIPTLYAELLKQGSNKRDITAKIAGGSSMFKQFKGNLDIGGRNVEAIKKALEEYRIPLVAEDVGGNVGRSITYDPAKKGIISVRRADGTCIDI